MDTSDAAAEEANQSEEEHEKVADDEQNRTITASEALEKPDEMKDFIEVNRADHLNMIFNELIKNVK